MAFFDQAYTTDNAYFKKAKHRAKGILNDPKRLRNLANAAMDKMRELRDDTEGMHSLKDQANTFVRMIRSYQAGDYKFTPWKSLLLITAGIIYFVSPLDLIPDFIPVLGFMDDITVLLWVLNSVRGDVEKYEEWEKTYAQPVR
ncbi:MAG: YkvA family protein [Tunicatimonas sp.]|uniref:YkvA family protein n=1 Tax=Tunicatimonas sp. TaxID=1940096 RepID=UPI003C7608E6